MSLEAWARDKLCLFLGFDAETIETQVWPYVMSTKTAEAFGERLVDMVGLTDQSISFIEEFTNRRFYPEKTAPPSIQPNEEFFPDLPTQSSEALWPANISVNNKKEEYLASLKKARKKKANQQELRSAAILPNDKPKKKKREIPLVTALKELGIQTTKAKICLCQGTRHALLSVAPNCLSCGRIRCIAEGVGPCSWCKMPLVSEEQELALIAEAKQKRNQQGFVLDKEKMREKNRVEKSKVMTINSRSKQVIVKNLESSDEQDIEVVQEVFKASMSNDSKLRGFYAFNPLLKSEKGPKLDQAFQLAIENVENFNILLIGDSGIGKTYMINHLAKKYNATIYTAVIGQLAAEYHGYIARGFKRLIWKATQSNTPCLIYVKDIDLFFGPTSESSELLPLFSQFLKQHKVLLVASTRQVDYLAVDVRAMFDQEIRFEIPTPKERVSMMQHIYEEYFYEQSIGTEDIKQLALRAHGFTAANLVHWFQEAEEEGYAEGKVTREILENTVDRVKVRGLDIMAEKPDAVYWKDIGGLKEAKVMLEESAVWIYKHADSYARLGIRPSKGLLLYGPPGTGKTMLAKAVATESEANFLAVAIPDLIKSEVGESEKAVSRIFQTAIRCSPCVIFLDELEAIFASRETSGDVGKKLISQFLIEMDGLDKLNAGVIVLGATNHPEAMDEAILRPGRLDRLVYIGPPNVEERLEILKVLKEKLKMSPAIDLERIARLSEGCTGADLKGIVRKAGLIALKKEAKMIEQEHIECVLNK